MHVRTGLKSVLHQSQVCLGQIFDGPDSAQDARLAVCLSNRLSRHLRRHRRPQEFRINSTGAHQVAGFTVSTILGHELRNLELGETQM